MTVAQTLRAIREARDMTQLELAARLGVTERTVRRWETGESMPGLDRAADLARALGVRFEVWADLPQRSVERWFVTD